MRFYHMILILCVGEIYTFGLCPFNFLCIKKNKSYQKYDLFFFFDKTKNTLPKSANITRAQYLSRFRYALDKAACFIG